MANCGHGWHHATDCDTCMLERVAPQAADRISELEAVLAFYADPDMHLRRGLDGQYPTLVTVDGGAAARAAVPNWEDIETGVDTAALLEA